MTYFLSGERYRNYVLLLFSLAFYGWGEPKFVFVMVAEVTVDYVAALLIGRCGGRNWRSKLLVALALALNLGLLVYFKYTGFLLQTLNAAFHTEIIIPNIVMPIGISFFTFQAMS